MKKLIKNLLAVLILFAGYTWVFAQGEAELMLQPSATEAAQGQEFSVDIVLKNPGLQNVISVRSWLTYDPSVLEALTISTGDSLFTLSAPGEDTISAGEGRVKIGRSNIEGGVSEAETTVATVNFRALAVSAITATIGFYDYQVSELGHTSVNIIDEGFPLNILSEEPESIQLSLNPGVAPPPVVTPEPTPTPTPTPPVGGEAFAADLARPINLKVNTGPGYVDLKWDAAFDSARVGFNIYYGQTSGQYTRRRTIGNEDNYRFTGLNNNETYYFALTAYDQFNRESDYSNEVGVIINQPLSSTNPFEALVASALGAVPFQPQNGPLAYWLIFSAAGLSGAILFGRRKRRVKITNL